EPGAGDPGRGAPRSGDPRRTDGRRTPGGITPPRGVAAARTADTGRTSPPRGADPLAGGPQPSEDPLSSGSFPNGAIPRGPSPKNPLATGPVNGDPLDATRVTGPFESRPGGYAPARGSGPVTSSGPYGRNTPGPAAGPADPRTGRTGDFPAGQSWPAQPAYPASGSYDILDGPEPPASGSNETWRAADYQMPARREGYATDPAYPASASSYEVRPGWATIDDGDATISAPTPSHGSPATPSRHPGGYEPPETRSSGGDPGYGGPADTTAPGTTSGSWPRPPQNNGGSWPSYSELYGNGGSGVDEPSRASRGGHHRVGDPEYPDYYR
ncbi:hypothetical protein ACFQ3A_40235, partial [Sphaerisporangium aureirubrum]